MSGGTISENSKLYQLVHIHMNCVCMCVFAFFGFNFKMFLFKHTYAQFLIFCSRSLSFSVHNFSKCSSLVRRTCKHFVGYEANFLKYFRILTAEMNSWNCWQVTRPLYIIISFFSLSSFVLRSFPMKHFHSKCGFFPEQTSSETELLIANNQRKIFQ